MRFVERDLFRTGLKHEDLSLAFLKVGCDSSWGMGKQGEERRRDVGKGMERGRGE